MPRRVTNAEGLEELGLALPPRRINEFVREGGRERDGQRESAKEKKRGVGDLFAIWCGVGSQVEERVVLANT